MFHLKIRHMQLAQFVPVGRLTGKIGLGLIRAGLAHIGQTGAVRRKHHVLRVQPRQNVMCQTGRYAALGQAKKRPRPLAVALDQASIQQQLEMPRHTRLRLA